MTRQYIYPSQVSFPNTMDARRIPLAYQDVNLPLQGVAGAAADVSCAPPTRQQAQAQAQAVDADADAPELGAPAGASFLDGAGTTPEGPMPRPENGPYSGTSTAYYSDSAAVPAQQAQRYQGSHRNGTRAAHRRRRHHRDRVPRGDVVASETTLRYSHDQTSNIHDRLSGFQSGPPLERDEWVEFCEERMRLEVERLAGIYYQTPRP